jgi:hypothetical protein
MRTGKCMNCGTERHSIKARGLCQPCYSLTLEIEQIQRWNPNDPSTVGCPRGVCPQLPKDILRMQASVINQHRDCLNWLRENEKKIQGAASSMDIEGRLKWVAQKAGARNAQRIMYHAAGSFDDFTPEQRSTIFEFLYRIEERRPGRWGDRINWSRWMNEHC